MVKGGDENRHGLYMIHAHVKLILQHSSPFIAHVRKSLLPLFISLGAHEPEDPQARKHPDN